MTKDFENIKTQKDLDQWVRDNIKKVHCNKALEKKVYLKRCELIKNQQL